jgi:hypothetical protein
MSSVILAGTTVGTSLSLTGDTSGELQIQTNNGATTAMTLTTGGAAVFTAGTVSAPAITTTGDTNTGIFFPAADTIAFTEGGAESMRIDSSGFVGIGTTSPTTALQVNGTVTAPLLADTLGGSVAPSSSVMRNRIINGAMVIDQRNAGAAVTTTGSYPVDRFLIALNSDGAVSAQQDSVAPSGFVKSLKWTTTTADGSLAAGQLNQVRQAIEGFNTADFMWGTANAATVTVSFWVRSSLTGTFAGSLRNNAGDRSYVFTYAISAANTWEYKTVTIAGDTTGTWLTTNGVGIFLTFDLGTGSTYQTTAGSWAAGNFWSTSGAVPVIGTLNATWQVTGVQLEKGTQATSFEYRQYQQELALCQRYYEIGLQRHRVDPFPGALGASVYFAVTKRATPTVTGTATLGTLSTTTALDTNGIFFNFTAGTSGNIVNTWTASSEL